MGLLDFLPGKRELQETGREYIVALSIPGLDKKDIKTKIRQDKYGTILEISASKEHERTVKDDKRGFYLEEKGHAEFTRVFGLEKEVLANTLKTKYENGIFEVKVSKK